MKLSFVLPYNAITGGIRAIFEYASHFQLIGHETTIYIPFIPFHYGDRVLSLKWIDRMMRGTIRSALRRSKVSWMRVRAPIRIVPTISARFIGDADVIFATSWPTAYSVASLPARKGIPIYFIFHYESDDGPEELVSGSYHQINNRVAISKMSAEAVTLHSGCQVHYIVKLGIDPNTFSPPENLNREPSLLVYLHRGPRKGGRAAIEIIEALRKLRPNVPISAFGHWPDRSSLPRGIDFFSKLDDGALADLYRRHSMFLYPSDHEGFGLPPLEAMASGCAIVATRTGAIPDYCEHGTSGIIHEPGDIQGLLNSILRLCDSPEERVSLARNATIVARTQFTWETAVQEFAAYLETTLFSM
jgi:glycosyltransferase involved in cell wall biosynthesis